ncbi:hypothetical protein GHK86_21880, partial [Acidimicrobiaceae bacterium USS-CC1]|nr:hypothetical protein [Acidiferrimicrobium australe]
MLLSRRPHRRARRRQRLACPTRCARFVDDTSEPLHNSALRERRLPAGHLAAVARRRDGSGSRERQSPVVTPRPRVVVVGAGFGGLAAVRGLASAPVDVTVVDQDNYHGFWPLLYQVASSELAPEDIAAPIRGMMSGRSDVEVRLGTVEGVDLAGRRVCLGGGAELRFDYLIVAGGTVTNDFGIPGVSAHAYTLKTLPDAVRLRNHVLRAFERADALAEGNGTPPLRPVTIVVAG